MKLPVALVLCLVSIFLGADSAAAADYALPTNTPGDRMLVGTFRAETE